MRSTLLTIPFHGALDLGPLGPVPVFGLGLLLAIWCVAGAAYWMLLRKKSKRNPDRFLSVTWLIIALVIFKIPDLGWKGLPIYGYGTLLFLGFIASASFAAWRIRREGADGDLAWDVAMWLFVWGIVGGRTFYVVQYWPRFFGPDPETGQPRSVGQILFGLINLPDGGLVLYGGLILASLAYWLFCRRRGVHPLALGDIAVSSVFVGLMFGRLGCLMHGCCYGDLCDLPWGISFPPHSVPFEALVSRGLMAKTQGASLPLHPTQIYDSLTALLLLLATWAYYPFRRRAGEVMAIGWLCYPLNRFLVEFLRFDESGKFGTMLTISQWVSLGILASGIAFLVWLQRQPAGRVPLMSPPPLPRGEPLIAPAS
ncbi:MAG: prolipoprotein diacylglyceryl transferase [Planctomycetales bacterium]